MLDLRLDHVAIGTASIAEAVPVMEGLLGGKPYEGGPSPGFDWMQWEFAGGGRIEILEPSGHDGFMHRFLARQGPGVHHVTFKVGDLGAICDRARARGYDIVGYNAEHEGWQEAFLHPKQAQGIVIQFAYSTPEAESAGDRDAWRADFTPPARAPESAPMATVIGPRLAAVSLDAARHQWSELLGAEASVVDGGLVFRWADCPLTIAVESGAERPGPLCIDVCADHALRLPDAPFPGLGTRFCQVDV